MPEGTEPQIVTLSEPLSGHAALVIKYCYIYVRIC